MTEKAYQVFMLRKRCVKIAEENFLLTKEEMEIQKLINEIYNSANEEEKAEISEILYIY